MIATRSRFENSSGESRDGMIWRIISSAAAPIFGGATRSRDRRARPPRVCSTSPPGAGIWRSRSSGKFRKQKSPELISPRKCCIRGSEGPGETVVADALCLPFADASFEAVTVAFGLRNMADWGAALREMSAGLDRGLLLVLDFSLPRACSVESFTRFYLHRCLPWVAGMVTGEAEAYDYLGASIEKFPSGGAMRRSRQEKNGFDRRCPAADRRHRDDLSGATKARPNEGRRRDRATHVAGETVAPATE